MDFIGIGIDITEIDRIGKLCKNTKFVSRFFSEEENRLFESKGKNMIQTVAANFAAKEAFSKAIGRGIRGFSLKDISVLRNEKGKPYIKLNNFKEYDNIIFEVSLTHTDTTAAAVVVAFKNQ